MNKTILTSLTALALIGSAALAASGTSMSGSSMSGSSMMGSSMSGSSMMGMTVDVNTATLAELEKVPGVNAKLAAAIIASRPYKNQAELVKKVKGIGKKNILKLGKYFTYGMK